jgi:hypothetical protein
VATEPVKEMWRDAGMGGERGPCLRTQARDHVDRARGKARLPCEIGEGEGRQTRLLRRFQDAGVAHGEGCAEGASDDLHRVVPRHDMARHPDGFAQGVDGEALLERDRLAHHLVGGSGIELAVAGQCDDVGVGLCERLADIGGLHLGQCIGMFSDKRAEPGQKAAPVGGGERAPVAVEGCLRGSDGRIDVLRATARDATDLEACGRVVQGQGVACGGRLPAARDEDLRGVEPGCPSLLSFR